MKRVSLLTLGVLLLTTQASFAVNGLRRAQAQITKVVGHHAIFGESFYRSLDGGQIRFDPRLSPEVLNQFKVLASQGGNPLSEATFEGDLQLKPRLLKVSPYVPQWQKGISCESDGFVFDYDLKHPEIGQIVLRNQNAAAYLELQDAVFYPGSRALVAGPFLWKLESSNHIKVLSSSSTQRVSILSQNGMRKVTLGHTFRRDLGEGNSNVVEKSWDFYDCFSR